MRHRSALIALAWLACSLTAGTHPQDPEPGALREAWIGAVQVGAMQAVMQFRIYEDAAGDTTAFFDSITEGRKDFAASWSLAERSLGFEVPSIGASYRGELDDAGTTAAGHFTQGGRTLELTLRRQATVYDSVNLWARRPQRPRPPYPYSSEEVRFQGADASVVLAGTLTLPAGEGPHPAVILVSGSGQQDRDETLMEHKPFLVLADHLGRHGLAVLRYDDRGTAASTGDFGGATTADFALDAEGALDFLLADARIDGAHIAIVGHSEGGLVAPMVAARRPELAAIVLLAGPGVTGERVTRSQTEALLRAGGGSEDMLQLNEVVLGAVCSVVRESRPEADVSEAIRRAVRAALLELSTEQRAAAEAERSNFEALLATWSRPWFRYFLQYDPAATLAQVRCPVLALCGSRDLQVLPELNLPALEAALGEAGNPDFEVRELPGLNHMFQACETGAMSEYVEIPETFNPTALEAVQTWLAAHLGPPAPARD